MAVNRIEDRENLLLLNQMLEERILVVDGATGTALERLNPTADDFGGEDFFGCNEMLNLHAPQIVHQLHRDYIEAGVDILETNSFNGSPIVLAEYGIADKARELAKLSAVHARRAIEQFAGGRKIFVMGSMGPGTRSISLTGGVTFDEVSDAYCEYAAGLLEGGSDILVLETVQDTLNLKAAFLGIKQAQQDIDREVPVLVSVTIELNGTMLGGQNIEALYHTISGFDLFSIGLNCATGPAFMTDHLRTLASISRFPVSVWPNAGMPDDKGKYSDDADMFRESVSRFAREGFINLAGGCCGTTPDHIRAVKDAVDGIKPRAFNRGRYYPALAGSEAMIVEADNRPVYVGERTNTIGSRKFKRLVGREKWNEAAEIGRSQVQKGAMVLDLCTADPDRDEVHDFLGVLKPLQRKIRVPLMIDTTDPTVVETALKTILGKPAINSVNLEDGGGRLRKIAAMAKQFGAALICGMIDDDPHQGMAITVERKLEVAHKIYSILKGEFDIPDGEIIFDPLVFPVATGDPAYLGSAKATINSTRLIKERFPGCLTILGISNVSFGLPPAGREIVNSVFLYQCTLAGLDLAIVNTQGLKRYPTISAEDRESAERLLFEGDLETITLFSNRFRDVKIKTVEDEWDGLSTEEQVSRAVVEARHEKLEANLVELLKKTQPLDIINGPLMRGMDEVGRLFSGNRLIVAEVLESAEVMKKAVDFLRPHFPPGASTNVKGKMLLATIKGDVHDIGKNLVDMIMSNNGFEVVNLGIKTAPDTIIEAARKHRPDIIGLSGLLVRSARQMIATADDLRAAGIDAPLLVGGAALTKKFTLTRICPAYSGSVFYAKDAMNGLTLGNRIVDHREFPALADSWRKMQTEAVSSPDFQCHGTAESAESRFSSEWIETDVPDPPDLDEHIIESIPIDSVLEYMNPQMLYGKHLGVRNARKRLEDAGDVKIMDLKAQVKSTIETAVEKGIIRPQAIYRWFRAEPGIEKIGILGSSGRHLVDFSFPRQKGKNRISAVDWLRPIAAGGDHVALFVVTSGEDTAQWAAELRAEGRLLDSYILQAAAIEIAEAAAEWLHKHLREQWQIADPPGLGLDDLFKTRYRGIRLSFGYAACPDIRDQKALFELLKPKRIGVTLTDGMMMHPESSVSAVVFHHPSGQYYTADK